MKRLTSSVNTLASFGSPLSMHVQTGILTMKGKLIYLKLHWHHLEDSRKDVRIAMFEIATKKYIFRKETDLKHAWHSHDMHFFFFLFPFFQFSLFVRLEPAVLVHCCDSLSWDIVRKCLLYQILIYETCE